MTRQLIIPLQVIVRQTRTSEYTSTFSFFSFSTAALNVSGAVNATVPLVLLAVCVFDMSLNRASPKSMI